MNNEHDYLTRILNSCVYDVARETPLDYARTLSQRTGNHIYLKREDEQSVFSFKIRGAYNKMAHLSEQALAKGVICASAGNHAQGVAVSARRLGARAVIVMPTSTPAIKVASVRGNGGEVVLVGDSFSDAYAYSLELAEKEGLTFVHPYDDPDVIAGQGTIGMEILRARSGPIHAIFCAVGGGGLISGVAAYIKRLRPHIRIIGVETVDADAMSRSLAEGRRVTLEHVGLFADGTAVKQVGEETFRLCQTLVDEMICVTNDAICAAIKDVFEDTRSILEPSGALAVAGAKAYLEKHALQGEHVVAVTSGANMNFDRLRFVAELAELGEQREAILAVTIPERPGAFRNLITTLGSRDVTEFNYRYADTDNAHVFVGVTVHNRDEVTQLIATLAQQGLQAIDLTGNEMAKTHIRYMVGGRAPQAKDEVLYSFVFPEHPGALINFLTQLHTRWNISLFHYRNHGADFGRVLTGMQVVGSDQDAFQDFLDKLGYEYTEETGNPAYQLFLK